MSGARGKRRRTVVPRPDDSRTLRLAAMIIRENPPSFGVIPSMPPFRLYLCFGFLVTCFLGAVASTVSISTTPPAAAASVEDRVRDLLSHMTLEEKVGQLVQYSSRDDMTSPASPAAIAPQLESGGVGSMLNLTIAAGETREVEFLLTPADLAFWRANLTFGPEPCDFDVFVGGDSDATLSASFTLGAAQ